VGGVTALEARAEADLIAVVAAGVRRVVEVADVG